MALPGLPDPGVRDLDRPACPAAMASPVVRDPPSRPRRDSWNSPAPVGADRAEGIAHGFRVRQFRVRSGRPGTVTLELVRKDALAAPMPALPVPAVTDLPALPVGRREDGAVLTLRLHSTHLLIAGATGAGKGSYLWGLIRAMLPAMAAGLVRVYACDPKLMEIGR